jgi:hypothetical protein
MDDDELIAERATLAVRRALLIVAMVSYIVAVGVALRFGLWLRVIELAILPLVGLWHLHRRRRQSR